MIKQLKNAATATLKKMNPKRAIILTYLSVMALSMGVFASSTSDSIQISTEDVKAENLVAKLAGTILDIFRWIGVLLLIWSVGQVVMAFKNEDADSKSRAMMMAIVSIMLITLKTILKAIGIISF